jgi:hypothetical protein
MTEKRVITPIGFLEILVEIDPSIPPDYVRFTRSKITVGSADRSFNTETNVLIGQNQVIPLKAGKYKASASLGVVSSEEIDLDIEAGLVKKVRFFFGKET